MASRILTFVSCTLYFFLLFTFTIIGFASFIIGSIGVGFFIPTSRIYNTYKTTTCLIVDVDYDTCTDSCYYVMWSVEYYISSQYTFSTIQKTFDTFNEITEIISIYEDQSNHTCYYDQNQNVRVQWNQPASPQPYLIMIIVGFSLTGIYLILIGFFYYYRSRKGC